MLKTIDDEFARYLASYLRENLEGSLPMSDFYEEEIYQLIKQFRQELP